MIEIAGLQSGESRLSFALGRVISTTEGFLSMLALYPMPDFVSTHKMV
jgi:hypothetical protein